MEYENIKFKIKEISKNIEVPKNKNLIKYENFLNNNDFELYDKITLLNTRNHRFLDGAVEILKEQPVEYCKFLKQNNFNHGPTNDLNLLFKVGKKIAKHYLPNQVYKNSLNLTKKILKIYEGM